MKDQSIVMRFPMTFVFAEDLEKVEEGVKNTQRGVDTANLAIAVAVDRIEREELYKQKGYKTSTEYFREAIGRLNMPKQTISAYRKIGRVYFQYKSRLQAIDFNPMGNLHKLTHLEKALENHSETQVFEALKEMSLRKFMQFAEAEENKKDLLSPKNTYTIKGNVLLSAKGEPLIDIHELDKIINSGETPLIIGIQDDEEKQKVQEIIKSLRDRKEQKEK